MMLCVHDIQPMDVRCVYAHMCMATEQYVLHTHDHSICISEVVVGQTLKLHCSLKLHMCAEAT